MSYGCVASMCRAARVPASQTDAVATEASNPNPKPEIDIAYAPPCIGATERGTQDIDRGGKLSGFIRAEKTKNCPPVSDCK